jgi:hypothetical protein
MKDEEFIDGVADRIALPRDDAKPLIHATLRSWVNGSAPEAKDLSAQLPNS